MHHCGDAQHDRPTTSTLASPPYSPRPEGFFRPALRTSHQEQQHRQSSMPNLDAEDADTGGAKRDAGVGARFRRHFMQDVDTSWGDAVLLASCFVSGLVDSGVFNKWSCFVSMQTGAFSPGDYSTPRPTLCGCRPAGIRPSLTPHRTRLGQTAC